MNSFPFDQLGFLMNKTIYLAAVLGMVLGQLTGMVTSDLAAMDGFPHKQYLVELAHEQTARSDFICMKRGALWGVNLSTTDDKSERQKNCILLLTGSPRSDGSFDVVIGSTTWHGRLNNARTPINVSVKEIKALTLLRQGK